MLGAERAATSAQAASGEWLPQVPPHVRAGSQRRQTLSVGFRADDGATRFPAVCFVPMLAVYFGRRQAAISSRGRSPRGGAVRARGNQCAVRGARGARAHRRNSDNRSTCRRFALARRAFVLEQCCPRRPTAGGMERGLIATVADHQADDLDDRGELREELQGAGTRIGRGRATRTGRP